MNPADPNVPTPRGSLDPYVVGVSYAAASALLYSLTNICLRDAATHNDPIWVSCVKAMPTVLAASLLVLVRWARGLANFTSRQACGALILAGLFAQMGGNVAFQWSLGVVGLALTVPLTLGTMITSSALLGRFWLGEPLTPRALLAMLLLIVSIVVLSTGAATSPDEPAGSGALLASAHGDPADELAALSTQSTAAPGSPRGSTSSLVAVLAATAACVSGIAYAVLGATIRRAVTGVLPLATTLLVVSVTGLLTLGTASVWHVGWQTMVNTPPEQMAKMLWAGVFNAAGFFALGKALELAPVIQINAVNASQAALAAIGGILIFNESVTAALVVGVALTIIGLVLIERPKAEIPEAPLNREPLNEAALAR